MPVTGVLVVEGRRVTATGLPTPFVPPDGLLTRVHAVCTAADGRVVLVSGSGRAWWLPGGGREPGETPEETLAREVWEEICGEVTRRAYPGSSRFDAPDHPGGRRTGYHARYWARVALHPFRPAFETAFRCLVPPSAFRDVLEWGQDPTAGAILEAALAAERSHR